VTCCPTLSALCIHHQARVAPSAAAIVLVCKLIINKQL